jgi:hypothetical protein
MVKLEKTENTNLLIVGVGGGGGGVDPALYNQGLS